MNEIKDLPITQKTSLFGKITGISKFAWLFVGFIISYAIALIESEALQIFITGAVYTVIYGPQKLFEIFQTYIIQDSIVSTAFNILGFAVLALVVALIGVATVIWYLGVAFVYSIKFFPIVLGIFSLLHVSHLFLTRNAKKANPAIIIFRILTVLFGIASIVCTVLFLAETLSINEFLRTAVFFFGGSIALNIAVE